MPEPTLENPHGHQPTPADGIDPGVKMPPHVVAAAARSTEAFNSTYKAGEHAEGTPPNGNGNGTPPPNGEPPAPTGDELPEVNADGTPNWENRFKALKGRYDANEKRTRETLEAYDERMRNMSQQLTQATRPKLPGEEVGETPPVFVTQKEIEDYGADLIDVIKRAAAESIMPMLKPIATEIGQMRARVETTESESGKQFLTRMHTTMNDRVPGWEELNRDPNFIAWTKKPDVYSGLNRQELLQKAWYAGDSNRVAAFFEGFLAEEAAVDPAASQARMAARGEQVGHAPPGPASTPQPAAPRVTLEALAAPGRARAAASAPAGKPVWTAEGISQFYMDCASGKFRGREAERAATEADLMAAQREGRIIVNPRTATTLQGN